MTWTAFFDPGALALVGVGSLVLATAQAGPAAVRDALSFALRRGPDAEGEAAAAARLTRAAAALVSHRGLFAAEQLEPHHHFLRGVLADFSDCRSAADFAATGEALRRRLAEPARRAGAWWTAVADAAPALGMVGTVGGMILLFSGGTAAGGIGAGLGLALVTTLYGLVLSAGIAGPIAARIARLSAEEAAWQLHFLAEMEALVVREDAAAHAAPVPPRLRRAG